MSPEYLNQLADIADPDKLWQHAGFDQMTLPFEKRQQLDMGVALRRHASHIRDLRALLGTGQSLLLTPLSPNGTHRRFVPTPSDEPTPIDMILHCPNCGMQHIDGYEAAPGHFSPSKDWTNPPHRSHLCHGCGHIWRPADVPTNGVAEIKTKGKNDSAPVVNLDAQFMNELREAISKSPRYPHDLPMHIGDVLHDIKEWLANPADNSLAALRDMLRAEVDRLIAGTATPVASVVPPGRKVVQAASHGERSEGHLTWGNSYNFGTLELHINGQQVMRRELDPRSAQLAIDVFDAALSAVSHGQ